MKISPELAYTIGVIGGDGSLTENRISVTDKNEEFHNFILKPIFQKLFNTNPVISSYRTHIGNKTFRTRINSIEAYKLYTEFFQIPNGKAKTFEMKTPKQITSASNEIVKEYIKGWMDAEAWITFKKIKRPIKQYIYPKIAFNVKNKTIRNELVDLLARFKIKSSSWESNGMFGFQIIGFEKVHRYNKKIGFNHPDKIRKMLSCLSEAKRGLQCAGQ